MKTKSTIVEGTNYIWAFPKTDWEIGQELKDVDGDMTKIVPFKYQITASDCNWRDDSVLVHEFTTVGVVPAGIDLVKAAVKTLRAEIEQVQADAAKKVSELEEKIKTLALIEYQPDDAS
jgi:hypothetical protein